MFYTLETVIIVKILGLKNLSSAFGLMLFFQGLASLIGTPIAGGIFDIVGNYDYSFYVAGGLFILASILGFAAQFLHRYKQKEFNTPL